MNEGQEERREDGCWLVAELGQVESVWEKWSDTCCNGSMTIDGASMLEVEDNANLVKALVAWGQVAAARERAGGEGQAVGLTIKVDSDGEGQEHRLDLISAPVSIQFAPEPVLRLLNLWLAATYLHSSESATYFADTQGRAGGAHGRGEAEEGASQSGQSLRGQGSPVASRGQAGGVRTSSAMPKWRRRLLSLIQMPLEQDGTLKVAFVLVYSLPPSLSVAPSLCVL